MKTHPPLAPVLTVRNLTIALPLGADRPNAVEGVSFDLSPREVLCIVGASGSGKSITAHAIMGLLPRRLMNRTGDIQLNGRLLSGSSSEELRVIRGREIGMIFQEPMTSLNPVQRVGDQIIEVFRAHGLMTPAERVQKSIALLAEVGLPEPAQLMRSYPHQLSGGQRQRVMIAMAIALEPRVLIADEPTTALDVTTQSQILRLIERLRRDREMGVIFITHDFGVVNDIADRVAVMCEGRIVEIGDSRDVLSRPAHEYTRILLDAVPSLTPVHRSTQRNDVAAMKVEKLQKKYVTTSGLFRPARIVVAAEDISFELRLGETLGLVGESGSGKSTVGKCLVRLLEPNAGSIHLGDTDLMKLRGNKLRPVRKRIQMIFQDPYASLNPRKSIGRIIADGPMNHGMPASAAYERARELIGLVGLTPDALNRYPHEFSGGQRQRIGIARALALEPDVIVADEAVSALDVLVQAQILDLLRELKERISLSMVFITHDLRVAAQICDRVAVMQRGKIVEIGETSDIFSDPQHPYTRDLIAAVPGLRHMSAAVPSRIRQEGVTQLVNRGRTIGGRGGDAGC